MSGDITALDSKTMGKWVAKIPKTGVTATGTKVISKDYFLKPWKEAVLTGKGLGKVGKGDQSPDTPAVRVFEALGSKSNKAAFLLLNSKTNSMKALIWGRKRGMAPKPFKDALAASADPEKYSDSGRTGVAPTSNTLVSEWMSVFREVSQTTTNLAWTLLIAFSGCRCLPVPQPQRNQIPPLGRDRLRAHRAGEH